MKKPRIPPLLSDLVRTTLIAFEDVLFDDCGGGCPYCGGETSGYDIKKKQFAVVVVGDQTRTVHVKIKRFQCRTCRKILTAGQPFYPNTRFGSPIVDLCVTLGETMPYSRVSSFLDDMGIIVDRWSVRNYALKNRRTIPAADMFGVRLPLSIINISTLAVGLPEGEQINTQELLAACGISP